MTHEEAFKSIMKKLGVTQAQLAAKMGYKSGQQAISQRLRNDTQISKVIDLAEALDYEVILQPKSAGHADWQIVLSTQGKTEKIAKK